MSLCNGQELIGSPEGATYYPMITRTLSLFISLLMACTPCGPDVRTGPTGPIVIADVCNDDGGDSSSESSGDDTSSNPTECAPDPGQPWGPCDGDTCVDAFCFKSTAGSVCMPGCDDPGPSCMVDGCGMTGTCQADGACIPACFSDADCPSEGMVCDVNSLAPRCVFPG